MPVVTIIAHLRTCYPVKFGVPRQSGLVPAAWGVIEFEPAFGRREAVAGIEAFSHLWLLSQFHLVPEEPRSLSVRPPRLGGNEVRGVFATRSPFRPNRMGLTVVKLEGVEWDGEGAPRLRVSGVDLVDGTPILDIKPYVRYADSVAEARSGYAEGAPGRVGVVWECEPPMDEVGRGIIEQSIGLQPQPAYQGLESRRYVTEIGAWRVEWTADVGAMRVVECRPWVSGREG